MSQFSVSREGLQALNEIQVSYTCMAPGMDPARLAGLNPDGCTTSSTMPNSNDPSIGYKVDCGQGFAVRQWQVTTTESVEYTCCAVAPSDGVEGESETVATVTTGVGAVELYRLAALNFNCPTGQALRAFSLLPSASTVPSTYVAKFRCVNVPLLRQVREINEQLQTVQWDQFKGSWILARIPNIEVRTPIVDIRSIKAVAPCGALSALETWAFGNHGNENQISMVNTCRRIQMDDAGCRTLTAPASVATAATCTVGSEVLKSFELVPVPPTSGSVRAPFWNINYKCCPATKPVLPTTDAQCSSVTTATRAAGTLQPWKFVLTEQDMAIDCQNRMLTGFTLEYPASSIQVNYTCCLFEGLSKQMGGVVSKAFQPQDFTTAAETTAPAEVRRVDVSARNATADNQTTFVSFRLDGTLFNSTDLVNSDFNLLVLSPLTHRFQDYRNFGDISVVLNADNAAAYLNSLEPETIVVVGDATVSSWSPKLEYALQRCGAKLLQQTQSGPYGLVGVCRTEDAEDTRGAVVEAWDSSFIEITGTIPFLYTAAPVAEFPARFIQTVEKQEPFPSERPIRPELVSFKPENLVYDEFCDLNQRRDLSKINCKKNPKTCPAAKHPCFHTYEKQMDEQKFWTLTQRDIDREYVRGVGEVGQAKFDADIAVFEKIMDFVEFGITIIAGAIAAFGPGSWATPGEEGAEAGFEGGLQGAKAAKAAATAKPKNLPASRPRSAAVTQRPPARARSNAVSGANSPVPKESPARQTKLKRQRKSGQERFEVVADVGDAIEDGRQIVSLSGRTTIDLTAKKESPNKDATPQKPQKLSIPGGGEVDAIPTPRKPDDTGTNQAKDMEDFNLAGWLDDNPIQTGISRILCDLYCTEDAVKQGNNVINTNIRLSNIALQTNIERLFDFQSKLIFFGLGQLREQLTPSQTETRALLQSGDVEAPQELQTLLSEMNEVPKLLETNFDSSKGSLALDQWYRTAGKQLTDSVEAIFAFRNASSESVASVRQLVEKFVAQRNLRQERMTDGFDARGRPATRAEFVQAATAQKTKVVQHIVKKHSQDLTRVVSMVGAANPAMYGNFLEDKAGSSLVLIRWNQITTAMAEAHRKQSLFADSKKRALKAAKEALNAVDGYIHCKGNSIADLQMLWQRAMSLSDDAGSVLLDAWGSTHEAHELLETAASQGLLHDMAEMASVSMPDVDHCMPFVSLLRIAHFQGVKAVDKALSPVLTQILVLDAIGRYQEREMKRLNLEVVQKRRSVSSIMELVGGIAHGVAKPGPASMKLVARSLNLIGSQICPAPAGCAGMLLNVSQNSSLGLVPDAKAEELWVSSTPGDLLLSKSPTSALTPCKAPMPHSAPEGPQEKLKTLSLAQNSRPKEGPVEELKELVEEFKELRDSVKESISELSRMQRMSGPSLLSTDLESARDIMQKLCGEADCSEAFQEKLVPQSSILEQFANLWLAREL